MLTSAAPVDSTTRRIVATLSDHLAWPDDAGQYLETQLDLAMGRGDGLPPHYDLLGGWLSREAEQTLATYRHYQEERAAGAPRRHFANVAQMRTFLAAAAPARLASGASLYGVLERWDDDDFQPMVASYLDYTGHGVPTHNQYLRYAALLQDLGADVPAAAGAADAADPADSAGLADHGACRSAAVELALARHADVHLAELIGYNLGRQQPCAALLAARHELNELGADADAFVLPADAAGSAPSALFTLRGVMARVSDPAAFYRRVDNGYRLHALAGRLALPAATPGPQAVMPPRDALDAPPPRHASYIPAPSRQAERPLIRHAFPEDEHAWEAIDSELRLLEARLASSDSKEEAMQILARLMTPGQQHTQVGLMAARIFSQLFRL